MKKPKTTVFSKTDGTIYGKIKKSSDDTFCAYWIAPVAYGGASHLIGEYKSLSIAKNKLNLWVDNKEKEQKETKKNNDELMEKYKKEDKIFNLIMFGGLAFVIGIIIFGIVFCA
jgi:uncharacterized protein YqhQ